MVAHGEADAALWAGDRKKAGRGGQGSRHGLGARRRRSFGVWLRGDPWRRRGANAKRLLQEHDDACRSPRVAGRLPAEDCGRRGVSKNHGSRRCADCVVQGAMTRGTMPMKCPACGEGKLVRDTRDIPYNYKGETTTIPSVRGEFCATCGESVLAATESKRVSAAMLEFNRQVNA